jgi:hypothetical protein
MPNRARLVGNIVVLMAVFAVGTARMVMAQTYSLQLQDSSGSIVGTLQYSVAYQKGQCVTNPVYPPVYGSYTMWTFSNFTFQETKGQGVGPAWGLGGGGTYISQSSGGADCPVAGYYPSSQITLTGGYGFSITFNLCANYTCSGSLSDVPAGYISPKYIVAAEVYAPPGNQSTVAYGNAQEVGNTTSYTFSYKSGVTQTSSQSMGITLPPFTAGKITLGGKLTNTATTQSSQTWANSTTSTTDLKTSSSYTTGGAPITWNGWWTSGFNPHDADYAWLWLNPVLPFEAPTGSTQTWFGYGYDNCDPVIGLDIYNVENGALENQGGGALPTFAGLTTSAQNVLARGWATPSGAAYYITLGDIPSACVGQSFEPGDSSGLSATNDYPNILAADPLLSNSYALNLTSSSGYMQTGDGRYTRASAFINPGNGTVTETQANTDFPFVQCGFVGCTPNSETYSATYTASSQLGSSTNYEYTETFGIDESFSASLFQNYFTEALSSSTSYTTTVEYGTKTDITYTTSNYGQFTIVGPPCTAGGSPCKQVYAGPGEFDVYQDNKFATFMFWPVQ